MMDTISCVQTTKYVAFYKLSEKLQDRNVARMEKIVLQISLIRSCHELRISPWETTQGMSIMSNEEKVRQTSLSCSYPGDSMAVQDIYVTDLLRGGSCKSRKEKE